jgi:putative effector of murein hydrolase LrgA (UPF0299 family)
MSSVESNVATFFSMIVTVHVICNLISYLGFLNADALEIASSYLASTLLSAIAFGYLLVSVSNGYGLPHFGYSFLILT